jgi:hypothetical protein
MDASDTTNLFNTGWLELFARIRVVAGNLVPEPQPSSSFVDEILARVADGVVIEDRDIGKWFADVKAADAESQPGNESVGVRFVIDTERHTIPRKSWDKVLFTSERVYRDLAKPKPKATSFDLVFTFINLMPISTNLAYFNEFAMNEIRRHKGLSRDTSSARPRKRRPRKKS